MSNWSGQLCAPVATTRPHSLWEWPGPMQIRCVVRTPLHQERLPGASAIRCNTWLQLAGTRHGAMQIRCVVRLCNPCPRLRDTASILARAPVCSFRFAAQLHSLPSAPGSGFGRLALAPNVSLPSARSLHFRHRTARPRPAGPVRWLVAAARRRQLPFAPIQENLASPTRTKPPKPTSRRAGSSPRLAAETLVPRWPSLPRGNVPAWRKSVAPPCSVLVHSIGSDLAAPATMLVPARLCLRAESGLCPEPRTQHGVANSAAPATHWQRRRTLDGSTR